jgi:uncharacterized protein (TIGR04255 family)
MTTYRNPPVTEVLAEFYFQPTNWDLTVPGLLYEQIKDDFPVKKMPASTPVLVPAAPGAQQLVLQQSIRTDRMFFERKDEKVLVQIAPNLLVVNNVKMYAQWEDFCPVIKSVFNKYASVVDNWKIARLGLQYVNQIRMPRASTGAVKMEDYFQFYPHTGSLPDHGPFAMSVQFPSDPKDPTTDWIEVQLGGIEFTQEILSAKLEIKSYTPMPRDLDADGIYNWLEQAHKAVVKMFEGCITEKTREMFRREADA